ncbi:MAG: 23S rRNA (uracil(1939)-C(5))-methyltransferase RlmD [Bacteroidales bacterium]|nr:23S rRNA (uracil(1939)-C(5))-methyltransferase RlmD [Candidatus Cryptobacteroides aphodequi]
MSKKKLDLVLENVTIESVAAEGKALAHVHLPSDEPEGPGRVLFVEFAVPGDVVNVRIIRKKKSFLEGRIERIVKPSEQRLEPFCKHFGVCGGCKWQPLPYELQLAAKQRQVYDQLVRIGHLELPEISPILGSDKTVFYRNKLEFTFSDKRWILADEDPEGLTDAQRCGLGFHVGKFFDKVLDIEKCWLQPEPSNAIRLFIKDYAIAHGIPFYNLRENRGVIRNMFVRTTDDGDVMLIVCFAAESEAIFPLLDAVADAFPAIKSLYYVINAKLNDSIADQQCILYRGDEAVYEHMEGLRFKIGPKSFYQTNTGQAYKLYSVAREYAALTGKEVVYDLYTGTGTIAQFVSRGASKVIGIEYVPEAIEDAKINASLNGIDNCEFYAGDMKDILTADFIEKHGRPEVMIVDPPRAGMHPDVVKTIMQAAPKRIVYVSCNPASQARDCAVLCENYRITAVRSVDMFPHTQHVENVCLLERQV